MDLLDSLEKATPQPGETFDQYVLVEELGRGGCGVVFKAENQRLGDLVAIKVMLPHMAPVHLVSGLFKRFEREAKILRSLRHPHVVRISDLGRTPKGFPYFVMELLEGQTLVEALAESPFEAARTAHVALQVLSALEAAHKQGVIHRDLKPGNIMLRDNYGYEDYVTVLDFGIAKLIDSEVTALTHSVSGTPWYMAPEQAKLDDDLDGRLDLYALGVIMAECLTGHRVVDITKPFSAAVVHASDEPLPFVDSVMASPLWTVIQRAASKDRNLRFPSAAAMREAIEALVATWPEGTAPPSLGEQATLSGEPTDRQAAAYDAGVADPRKDASVAAAVPKRADPVLSPRRSPWASAEQSGLIRVPQRRRLGPALAATVAVLALGAAVAWLVSFGADDEPSVGGDGEATAAPIAAPQIEANRPNGAACEDGDAEACLALGRQLESGVDGEPDIVAARWLFSDSCERGVGEACQALARSHQDDPSSAAEAAQAVELLERVCRDNATVGCTPLGLLQRRGLGIARDESRAGELFDRACNAGDLSGCFELGLLYEHGLDGRFDDERTAALYEQSCEGGIARACTNLGVLRRSGRNGEPDPDAAARLFESSCEAGDPNGCHHLAGLYALGEGVERDGERARELWEDACEHGVRLACSQLRTNTPR